jgi:hypothetical protein
MKPKVGCNPIDGQGTEGRGNRFQNHRARALPPPTRVKLIRRSDDVESREESNEVRLKVYSRRSLTA